MFKTDFLDFLFIIIILSLFSQTEYGLAANAATTQSLPGFISVGDWGSAALGGYHLHNAEGTSAAMKTYIMNNNKNMVESNISSTAGSMEFSQQV